MMTNAGNSGERGTQRGGSLLDKIKSWDEAMQWSERYVKSESDAPSEQWSPLYEPAGRGGFQPPPKTPRPQDAAATGRLEAGAPS